MSVTASQGVEDSNPLEQLRLENAELRMRLQEAEDTLQAIRTGEVDALVVGNDLYTLESSHAASNKLRQNVLAQMEDAVLAFDVEDHVIFMNAAAERQYGQGMSAALGRHKREIVQELQPEGTALSTVKDRLRERGVLRERLIHRMPDGKEANVDITASVLRDVAGRETGLLYVVRNIDERVQADIALAVAADTLAQQKRQFATLVENSPDIFARMDKGHRYLYVSPVVTHYTGLDPVDFLGRTSRELGMPPQLRDPLETALDEVFAHRESRQFKFRFTTVTGENAVFHTRLVPEFDLMGEVESVLSIAIDITEQERVNAALQESQARLQEADSRKDQFLATLAHELRNSLAPLRNAMQMMRLSQAPEVQESARNILSRQLTQMVRLVDDLLDISRISSGKMELRREVADISAIVQSAAETSRPLIEAGRHDLTLHVPVPGSLMVHADVARICQAVANLLNNAAKYTPDGGRIEVRVYREEDDAVVTVRDNGVGIPAEMQTRVFDMFTQINVSAGASQGGLGIGLALVKRLLDLHGGQVTAESEGPGKGATFTVRLPLSLERAEKEPEQPALILQPPPDFRVLVVDDNVDSAISMASLLEMLGYPTEVAHDGRQALVQAEQFMPRAVLLDIGLPLLNGHEVARRLRSMSWGQNLLLIAVSGWGQDADIEKSRVAGFDHHFAKPVELRELTKALEAAHDRPVPSSGTKGG